MPIPRTNPRTVPSVTFDEWFITRFEVYPDPQGSFGAVVEFVAARNTGQPLLDGEGNPRRDAAGKPRTIYELDRSDTRTVRIESLAALARSAPRYGQAIDSLMELVATHAKAIEAID